MKLDDSEGIEEAFTYHPPTKEQQELYVQMRDKFKDLAQFIIDTVPASATRTVALRKLWETSITVNSAIATEGKI
jgi:RecA/RadA recombinase